MNSKGKQLSNPTSTGGLGIHFENRVQASFVVMMLTGGFSPCLPTWPIHKIKLQGKYQNFDTDDLIIYVKQPGYERQAKLLGQVKHSISLTKGSKLFGDVVQAAWSDFNKDTFIEEIDAIALITGPLSATDTNDVRNLLRQAKYSENAEDFLRKIELGKFTSNKQREKMEAFRFHLKDANNNVDPSDDQVWRFLKSFHLLIYDLDIKGVTLSFLHTLIAQYSEDRVKDLLARIEQEVAYESENAGYITVESLAEDVRMAFKRPIPRNIPENLIQTISKETDLVKSEWNRYDSKLVFANLLGSWNEHIEGDKAITKELTRDEYEGSISKIREVLQESGSPFSLKNGIWSITDREELWKAMGPKIFDDKLKIFKHCAVTVLSERDPKFELSPSDRFAASIYGKEFKYSPSLRKGISESLALLGSRPEALANCSLNLSENIATLAVREILEKADWKLWGSLNSLLPLLAEAAPNEFLNAVEKALSQKECPFKELFLQEGKGFTSENYFSGLLWAMETLAWDEQYLVRVTVLLGEIASLDLGGNWSNRPSNSLTTIFLPWFPQTIAPIEKRRTAIQILIGEFPKVGWEILLSLLPMQKQTTLGSHKPAWRKPIPIDWSKEVSQKEYWEQISIYADMAVDFAKYDIGKINEFIVQLDDLPQTYIEKVLEYLSSVEILSKTENERVNIWRELIKLVSKHRRHADAKWALSTEIVAKIESVAKELAPQNPLNLYSEMFSNRDFEHFEETVDWEAQEQRLEEHREQALKDILNYGGFDAILQFIEKVESPSKVGYSLGTINETDLDSQILPMYLETDNTNKKLFISQYIWARQHKLEWAWVDGINMNGWTPSQIGQFFAYLPFKNESWIRIKRLLGDDEKEYWRRVNVNPFQSDSNLEIAIDKLIEYGRPMAAIECLYSILHKKQPLDKTRAVSALLAAISSTESSHAMDSYHIVQIIKVLQDDSETDRDSLLQVEWAYLSLLETEQGASPTILESELASNPNFFCELIQIVYRSDKEPKVEKNLSEQQKTVATNAYRLLNEWRTPPGTQKDGTFNGDDFLKWLEISIANCTDSGHLKIALQHVGEVLFYCPPDTNGLWIDRIAAETINGKEVEQMRIGYRLKVFNSRGVHWIDPTGKPEFELAAKYRKQAEDIENAGYHRFATILRELAKEYDREAERIILEHKIELEYLT
jgi:hypothetical protein